MSDALFGQYCVGCILLLMAQTRRLCADAETWNCIKWGQFSLFADCSSKL